VEAEMNERIREFAIQSGSMEWGDSVIPATINIEKFAELIIKDCLSIADNRGAYQVMDDIIERFGVEL
jgi:hypothetical protein